MFWKIFFSYTFACLGICGIGFSALAVLGDVVTDGLLIPGIIFVVSIVMLFAGWVLRSAANRMAGKQ